MPATVTPIGTPRPKRTPVPNKGGRPTDPTIEGFEGVFDGLCAELNDLDAMDSALQLQREMRQIEVTLMRQVFAGVKSTANERLLRQLHILSARVINHLSARKERLKMVALPEARRIVHNLDQHIIERDEYATRHEVCQYCHGAGFVL
jgi:hypothetical protein